jgi:uncharacterized membrane protein YdbT with pleckstrin-like domain
MQQGGPSRPVERVIFETKQHWILVSIPLLGYGLLAAAVWILFRSSSTSTLFCVRAPVIIAGVVSVARATLIYATTRLTVTNTRVILRSGLLRQWNQEILLSKVESIDVHQAPLCLLLGCGTITIVGTGGTEQTMRAASHPFIVRDSIHRMLETRTAVNHSSP